jgi:hypothetical protein
MRFRFSPGLALKILLSSTLVCLAYSCRCLPISGSRHPSGSDWETNPTIPWGAPVETDGRPILQVYASVGGVSPEERAANIKRRILRLARKRAVQVDVVRVEDSGAWTEILAGNLIVMIVSEGDAAATGGSFGAA